jgi:hypothetical protein
MKLTPTCSCSTRDGSRCGRKVTDGSQPPVCHIHKAQAAGSSVSPLTSPAPFDALEKITKLAAKEGPSQLGALKLLMELDSERSCPRCAARDADASNLNLELCTPEEHDELKSLAQRMIALKQTLRIRTLTHVPTPPEPEPDVIDEPVVEPAPQPEEDDRPTVRIFAPIELHALPRDKWAAAGLYEENGVVTHTYGDEYAAKILNLEIPYDDACRDHAAGTKTDQQLADSLHKRFLEKS